VGDIIMDAGPQIDERFIKNLRKRLQKLEPGNEVTIRLEAADAHQAGGIIEELKRQGLDYQPHGGHGSEYYLIAKKKQRN